MCRSHIKEMNLAEKRDRLPAPFTAPTTAGYANFVVDQCKGFMFGRSERFRADMPCAAEDEYPPPVTPAEILAKEARSSRDRAVVPCCCGQDGNRCVIDERLRRRALPQPRRSQTILLRFEGGTRILRREPLLPRLHVRPSVRQL